MRYCDPNGPVVVVVEKLTCGSERTDFFCVGRVLSGTLTSSQLINVIGPDYQQGRKEDYYVGKHITGLFKLDGTVLTEVESCTAGTLAIVSGVAKYMMCFGTLMSLPNPFPLSRTRITKSLPTKVVVGVKDPVNLPCFYEGIKLLCKGDPVAQVCIEETGEYVLHACSPRHADLLISELLKYFTNLQSGLLISGQRTAFCETVSAVSSLTVCAKSPNKHSRMWMTAEPMDAPLLDAIYSGKLKMNKLRELDTSSNSVIVSEIGWTRLDAAKIWCFSETEDCMICNRTKGAQYLHELKDYILYEGMPRMRHIIPSLRLFPVVHFLGPLRRGRSAMNQ
jgi:elongation factor 2